TELDILAKNALTAAQSPEQALRSLYGPVYRSGRPVSVYIGSSTSRKGTASSAAFSLFWGVNSSRNSVSTFVGTQTEARCSLLAVLRAVIDSPKDNTLIIFTSSQYAIRSFCYWATDNATMGWPCAHADVLMEATTRIQCRPAPVEFRWVPHGKPNAALSAAKILAS
ncbi:hypothetical protein C8R43DRAFT_826515, partial [Mycena crocata]